MLFSSTKNDGATTTASTFHPSALDGGTNIKEAFTDECMSKSIADRARIVFANASPTLIQCVGHKMSLIIKEAVLGGVGGLPVTPEAAAIFKSFAQ